MDRILRLLTCLLVASAISAPHATNADLTAVGDDLRVDPQGNQVAPSKRTVARFSDGGFVVVYRQALSPDAGQWAQRYDATGTPIGTRTFLSAEFSRPLVATRSDDSFVAVWPAGGDSIGGLRVAKDGTPIGTEFQFSPFEGGYVGNLSYLDVAVTPDDGFIVVWNDPESPFSQDFSEELIAQRFDSVGSAVGTAFLVNTYTDGNQQRGRVAVAPDGDFVVVWESGEFFGPGQQDGSLFGVFGQRFNGSAAPVGTEFQVNTFTTYSEDYADVAVHGDGSFVVVWRTQYGDEVPQIGISDSVTFRRYGSNGLPIGDEFHLNSYVTGGQRKPVVAMDDDGSFVVAFESHSSYNEFDLRDDGVESGMFARCFDASGLPVGDDFHVNSYTTGNQVRPSIATDGSGEFVVAWSRDGSYSGYVADGIAARLFSRDGGTGSPTLDFDIDTTGLSWSEGVPVAYDLEATSIGGPTADVSFVAEVPARTTYHAGSSSPGWSCADGSGPGTQCTFDVGTVGAGQTASASFGVVVDDGTSPRWEVYPLGLAQAGGDGLVRPRTVAPRIFGGLSFAIIAEVCSESPGALLCSFCFCIVTDISTGGNGPCTPSVEEESVSRGSAGSVSSVSMLSWIRSAGIAANLVGSFFLLRDTVLEPTRGGTRATDLFLEHSPGMTAAAMADSDIATHTADFLDAWRDHVDALVAGDGDQAVITQAQVDAMSTLLDALVAAADPATAQAITRERDRVDPSSWAGLDMNEALALFDLLSCEGFEDLLFCGELSGDCAITATDALIVLRMAVGTLPARAEADVDGSGSTVATDALLTLKIAVGTEPPRDDCNL